MSVLGFEGVACQTPQLLLDGSSTACDCCDGCRFAQRNADRQRKFYWSRRRKFAETGKRVREVRS